MIISEKYKYVFIQNQMSASSSTGLELIKKYDGEYVLEKHSFYRDFLKLKGDKAKDYFVFCGIRNPLDTFVTAYYKRLRMGNLPGGTVISFASFLDYFLIKRVIIPKHLNEGDYKKVDFVIKYEKLQEDFSEVNQG